MALLLVAPMWAAAETDGGADEAALTLADSPSPTGQKRHDWRMFTDVGVGYRNSREGAPSQAYGRLSLDVAVDTGISERWRVVLSSRLDVSSQPPVDQKSMNTLKEAYVSFKVDERMILDAGRVNTRYGVATGYNPTDFFRAYAVRSLISVDPEALRQNRLGSAMLRGQWLWDDGSLTALYSPRVDAEPNERTFSPDWGASNPEHRYLISASHRFSPALSPEVLLYGVKGQPPIVGINQSFLLGDATVAYLEWSGGRDRTLLARALGQDSARSFHSRLAGGLSYTSPHKDTLTLEYHYNEAALNAGAWEKVQQGAVAPYLAYRQLALETQDLPTHHGLFLHYRWKDAMISGLDLSALARIDLSDKSALYWLQARYAWSRYELALSSQWYPGGERTVFGGMPQRSVAEVMLRVYF